MNEVPMVTTYMGKRLTDMSREELIAALEHVAYAEMYPLRALSPEQWRAAVRCATIETDEVLK